MVFESDTSLAPELIRAFMTNAEMNAGRIEFSKFDHAVPKLHSNFTLAELAATRSVAKQIYFDLSTNLV